MESQQIVTSVLQKAFAFFPQLLVPLLSVLAIIVAGGIILRRLNPKREKRETPRVEKLESRSFEPPPSDTVGSYRKQSFILSKAEMTFYGVLQKAAPPNTIVLPQIPLRRVIAADRGAGWQSADNRIARKYVDFVVCDQWTRPLAVVELDDSSHTAEDRQMRDDFLDAALGSAGVPIVHVAAANGYSVETLRDLITAKAFATA